MDLIPSPEAPTPVPTPQPEPAPLPQPEKEPSDSIEPPEHAKRFLSLFFTLLAALLYGAILGGAVVKSLFDSTAVFNEGALRATQILSGLVGTVVTAGFARGKSSNLSSATPLHEKAFLPTWYSQGKLLGLAETLGLNLGGLTANSIAPLEDEHVRITKVNTATWVAGIYFILYFLVGAGAFLVTILRPQVPELISNSAWVWLGTLISSSYSFFALGNDNKPV
ncbi:MAG: hypothetical protein ACYCZF_10740 [Anaerolineae bacterium]